MEGMAQASLWFKTFTLSGMATCRTHIFPPRSQSCSPHRCIAVGRSQSLACGSQGTLEQDLISHIRCFTSTLGRVPRYRDALHHPHWLAPSACNHHGGCHRLWTSCTLLRCTGLSGHGHHRHSDTHLHHHHLVTSTIDDSIHSPLLHNHRGDQRLPQHRRYPHHAGREWHNQHPHPQLAVARHRSLPHLDRRRSNNLPLERRRERLVLFRSRHWRAGGPVADSPRPSRPVWLHRRLHRPVRHHRRSDLCRELASGLGQLCNLHNLGSGEATSPVRIP